MKVPSVDALEALSYRELQKLCSELSVSVPNRKKVTLLNALREHVTSTAYEAGSEAGSESDSSTARAASSTTHPPASGESFAVLSRSSVCRCSSQRVCILSVARTYSVIQRVCAHLSLHCSCVWVCAKVFFGSRSFIVLL
jgi:hypothetical protein